MSHIFLDHIVILLPHAQVIHPPLWLTKHFAISPGGRHAGGQTENKLIIFQDGSYIELIAFVDDSAQKRAGHRWGKKEYGIIDYALITSSSAENNHAGIQKRLADARSAFTYEPPEAGGRKREDGEVLQWKVTVPEDSVQRGELPFFCHDVTPRDLRVPVSQESTTHPSGAYGVKQLAVLVDDKKVEDLVKAYGAVLNLPNSDQKGLEGRLDLPTLNRVEKKPLPRLSIKAPAAETEKAVVAQYGLLLHDLVIGGTTDLHWSKLEE
ncbi:glyoxalase bleomycin resistance protein dioxygenase superfamily [Phlyctema vagabunda]|uniref:Glyoxalase bleomycin resistance protein dioxygenase superfamily n=1 Tax=Phlyctema vagabunda TaxID=108571 RepID=A0ABR4PHG6_9HELO